MLYIGLPQWSHPKWRQWGIQTLETYARHFNCVEGNTTLYALPSPQTVLRWQAMTHDAFRFCFKFPATITHQATLRDCQDLTHGFFARLAPLENRMAQFWLQLPARFGPENLPALWAFLDTLPAGFTYGVEVRHQAFFAKGPEEQAFNRGIYARGVNRVILDSRPVHTAPANTPAMQEAQRKKPRVPVHAVLTGSMPMVRFIASDDMAQSETLFADWLPRLEVWARDATPLLFLHTPDIGDVSYLVNHLAPRLNHLAAQPLPTLLPPGQPSLF